MSESDYLDYYDDDHMNFVTNLFESCEEYYQEDPDLDPDPFNFTYDEDLGLGFAEEFDMMTLGNAHGLRVVGIDSDSDTEERVFENGSGSGSGLDIPISEDVVLIEDESAGREDSDLEDRMCSVIERIEEISFSSGTCSEDEEDFVDEYERNLDWEILLAVNNLDRNIELGNIGDDLSYLDVDDDIYEAEYDVVLGQIVENANALKINLPAAKSVVENLPSVVFTKEDLEENDVVCAVCKEDVVVAEEVTRLPCCHHYHGECILPWLKTRNTCPVCRFELPTDNANYEHVKFGEAGLRYLDNLQSDKICSTPFQIRLPQWKIRIILVLYDGSWFKVSGNQIKKKKRLDEFLTFLLHSVYSVNYYINTRWIFLSALIFFLTFFNFVETYFYFSFIVI